MAKLLLSWATMRITFLKLPLFLQSLTSNPSSFLRWKAIQDAVFVDPLDGKQKVWSESNVSEDFDMALRLILKGYITRCVSLSRILPILRFFFHGPSFQSSHKLTLTPAYIPPYAKKRLISFL